jgi:hypothetical protein
LVEIRKLHENDKHDAQHLFPDQWKNAEESLANAGQQYEEGEFEKAILMLKQATDDFSKVNQNAKDYILNQYKDLAESAIAKKDWPLLSDYAKKLFEINSEQGEHYLKIATTNINIETLQRKIKEAQSEFEKKSWDETINRCKEIQDMLKNEPELKNQLEKGSLDNILEIFDKATLEVTSNLKIKAMIGVDEVNADIWGLGIVVGSHDILRQLEYNKAYTLELSYIHQGEKYEGSCAFIADWIGVKQLTVQMRKSVDILLETVQDLTEKRNWEEVLATCKHILELDKENQNALKLKEIAELETTSNARIRAMVGTEEVNADISGTMRDVKTNDLLRNLEFGKEYSLELSYLYGEDRYEGSCTFTADWKGVKEFSIEMRKSVDILLEKAYKLADEKSWAEVQLNCQRILELDKENVKALNLKEKAELELTTNLKIKAMIGATEVNADITGLHLNSGVYQKNKSYDMIRNLKLGHYYYLKLSYIYNRETYEGVCAFSADWLGVKELDVKMAVKKEIKNNIENKISRKTEYKKQNLDKLYQVNNNPKYIKELLDEASYYYLNGKLEDALAICRYVLRIDRKNKDAQLLYINLQKRIRK